MASYLCRFNVQYAEDILLRDNMGTEIRLIGKTFTEALAEIRAYSMPAMQLFARVRMETMQVKSGSHTHKSFCMAAVPDSEPLREGDLLLNIPVI